MDIVLVIAVVGLAVALVAAMVALRNRAAELDALVAARSADGSSAALVHAPGPGPGPGSAPPEMPDDLLPIGVLHLGVDRRVDRANARAHTLLDVPPGRLTGRTVMELFLDVGLESTIHGLAPGSSVTAEIRSATADLRSLAVRVQRSGDGGTWIALEDVTELRRLQQIRTEFIDNLSHELRTPLSTVSLLAETLARDAEGADVPPRMRERIAKVEVETGHLVQMVSELLDLARIEGGTDLRLDDEVDLARLATASAERLRLFAERQRVDLVVRVDPATPRVRGDEDRLGQVFVNLVHNAVKFSPDGGEVAIDVRPVGDEVVASVTDHGIGISRMDRGRIFERFYKADRARVRGGGTGLGLSIARHVVDGHGGRIWVESEEGRGSTFSFAIPPGSAQAGDTAPPAPVPATPGLEADPSSV